MYPLLHAWSLEIIGRVGFGHRLGALEATGKKAVLHGSMVEITILSFNDQTATDLLNGKAPCYVDDKHHLQGAKQLPLRTAADVVAPASPLEVSVRDAMASVLDVPAASICCARSFFVFARVCSMSARFVRADLRC